MAHAEAAPEPPQVNGSRKVILVYCEGISLARAFSGCGNSGRLGRTLAEGEVEIARARDLSGYLQPKSAAFAAGPHRRSR
jgi:hypothetical protein